jgi:hypothetical protein
MCLLVLLKKKTLRVSFTSRLRTEQFYSCLISIDFGGESKFNFTRVYSNGNNKCILTSVLRTQ